MKGTQVFFRTFFHAQNCLTGERRLRRLRTVCGRQESCRGRCAAISGVQAYEAFPAGSSLGEGFSSPVRAYNRVTAHDT